MIESGWSFLLYAAVKYAAYTGWAYLGLRLAGRARLGNALSLGLVRFLLGVAFGFSVFLVGGMMHLNVPAHPWRAYFLTYTPIRWIEWSILSLIIRRANSSLATFLAGRDTEDRWWRLGGILISHLADIPLILSGSHGPTEMLPVGRFLC